MRRCVRRSTVQLPSRPAFLRAGDPEDHPHAPLAWLRPPLEAHQDAAAVEAGPSLTRESRAAQVDVEPDGSPDMRPQVGLVRSQAGTGERYGRQARTQ